MRLVPLWDVEEDILEPIVRRILVLARLVLEAVVQAQPAVAQTQEAVAVQGTVVQDPSKHVETL